MKDWTKFGLWSARKPAESRDGAMAGRPASPVSRTCHRRISPLPLFRLRVSSAPPFIQRTYVGKLHETYPERDFYLIIGSDNWARFDRWYQSERIIKENRILIYPRPGFPVNENGLPETVRLVHSPTFEISSTFIRQALDEKKDVRYFLHPKVWEYISDRV